MSFNMRDYVSDDHIESIGEIAKSQSAIIQALSLENSKLETQLQQKENIIKEVREELKEDNKYLESAKEMYINQNNEILKTHTLQLINNSLVQNDKLLKILEKESNK